jgi:hypothetical protein
MRGVTASLTSAADRCRRKLASSATGGRSVPGEVAACYASLVGLVLRASLILAAVTPLFAATAQPAWWQIFIAAAIGSALGQLAARFTRGRRIAAWSVAAAAAVIAAGAAAWLLTRDHHDDAPRNDFLVVKGTTLTWDDVKAIKELPSVQLAAPYLRKSLQLASEDSNWSTEVVGTTPDYLDLRHWKLAAGERFEMDAGKKVVVLGSTVVAQLGIKSPVGETIRIRNVPFEVIGVLAHHGMTPEGRDLDDIALVPLDVYRQKFADTLSIGATLLVSPPTADVRGVLLERHHGNEDFEIH